VARARAGYPDEVCGVLLADAAAPGRVSEVVPVPNVSTDPRRQFEIAPADLLSIQRKARFAGREILGYYHSHPGGNAAPSEADRRLAAEGWSEGVVHLIVGVAHDGNAVTLAWVFREETQGFEPETLEID